MYKMILVDDESGIREGLARLDWTLLNIDLVKMFDNGLSAYEYILHHPVDIVLTDIRMPMLDGIELIKILEKEYPRITKVVLSGCLEFEYAKQCIENHVRFYISKPAGRKEILKKFEILVSELNQKTKNQIYIDEVIEKDKRATNILKNKFLKELLFEKMSLSDIQKNLEYVPLDPLSGAYRTIVLSINKAKQDFEKDKWEMISLCLEKTAALFFEDNEKWHFYMDEKENRLYLVCTDKNIVTNDELLEKTLNKLIERICVTTSVGEELLRCTVGRIVSSCEDIYLSTQEAISILNDGKKSGVLFSDNNKDEKKGKFLINKALEYIHTHYHEEITLKQVAENCFLHHSYFSFLFKKETGKKFIEYLTDYRIEQAKKLLKQPEYRINEIANMCGYESHKYFSSIFREKTGKTPSEYRREL